MLIWILLTLYVKTAFSYTPAEVVREENLQWVRECSQRVSDLKSETVNYKFAQLCKKPHFYHTAKAHFLVRNTNHQISLNYKIRLKILPTSTSGQDAQKMLQLAKSCSPYIQSVWQRYGVDVQLSFDSNREPQNSDPRIPLRSINFYNYEGRGNAENLYNVNAVDFCKVVAHEVGHHLGLSDEYEDLSCPDRAFVSREINPYSIMGYMYFPWEQLDFFSRHLRTVLTQFCGGGARSYQPLPQGDWVDLGPPP